MSTTFSAQEPALGYYYQIIRGLLLLLNEDRLENPWLSFECMDDISIETPEETDLYQTKLHVTKAQLTDRSTDFWKTIRVWSEGISNGIYLPERTIFTLVTTANCSTETFISKFGSEDEKDMKYILQTMTTISQEKGSNTANAKGYCAFMALTEEQKEMLIKNIRIAYADLSIEKTMEAIRNKLKLSAPSKFLDQFVDGVVGWWYINSVQMLLPQSSFSYISQESVHAYIDTLRDQLRADALPEEFYKAIDVSDAELEECQSKKYIKQLSLVDATDREKRAAISDYQRAYGQRSKWLRDGRVTQEEYDVFDSNLCDNWTSRFGLIQDQVEDKTEEERKQVGHNFYRDFYVDPKHDMPSFKNKGSYITKGSYQMLSDQKVVGWHPDYKTILIDDETVE